MQDLFLAGFGDDDAIGHGGRFALLGPLQPTGIAPTIVPKLAANGVDLPTRLIEVAAA
jgi:hypothetical protein